MTLVLAIQFANASASPNKLYDCKICCEERGLKNLYGHDKDGEGMPEEAYHMLGPWTEELKLRRCPTHTLNNYGLILRPFFDFHDDVIKGIVKKDRDEWTHVFYEAFWHIDQSIERGKSWLMEIDSKKREQDRQQREFERGNF
jgi:hypothetical protein